MVFTIFSFTFGSEYCNIALFWVVYGLACVTVFTANGSGAHLNRGQGVAT